MKEPMTYNRIQEEIQNMKNQDKWGSCNDFDLDEMINSSKNECDTTLKDTLSVSLSIYDEGIKSLIQMQELLDESIRDSSIEGNLAYLALVSRACHLILAVRDLIMSGFEEPARCVYRSYIETVDTAMATLVDGDLGESFFSEKAVQNPGDFWKENIAYGRLNQYHHDLLANLGFDEEFIEEYKKHRKYLRSFLSDSIHTATSRTLQSFYIPSLKHEGMLHRGPFGYASAAIPGFVNSMIFEIHTFGTLNLKMMMSEKPHSIFKNVRDKKTIQSFISQFFVYQNLIEKYENELETGMGW